MRGSKRLALASLFVVLVLSAVVLVNAARSRSDAVAPIAARPIEIGKEDAARFHGKDERISKQNLELAVRVYVRLLESSAG